MDDRLAKYGLACKKHPSGHHEVTRTYGKELCAQVGDTVLGKIGLGFESSSFKRVKVVKIQFVSVHYDLIRQFSIKEDIHKMMTFVQQDEDYWVIRYGHKVDGGIRYLYEHDVYEGKSVKFTGNTDEVHSWLKEQYGREAEVLNG
jgi:hypothetical protein